MGNLHAIYGNDDLPLHIGPIKLKAYILSDTSGVIEKKSFEKALGYDGTNDSWITDVLGGVNKFYPVAGWLFDELEVPIIFFSQEGALKKGLRPEFVTETCRILNSAKQLGYLNMSQVKIAKPAKQLQEYFEKNPITESIVKATGLQFARTQAKIALEKYLLPFDSIYGWVKVLRPSFFERMWERNGLNWHQAALNPEISGNIIHEVLFSRLDENQLTQLRLERPKRTYERGGINKNNEPKTLSVLIDYILELSEATQDYKTILLALEQTLGHNTMPPPVVPASATTAANALDRNLLSAVQAERRLQKRS